MAAGTAEAPMVEGTDGQLTFHVGGSTSKRPTSSSLRIVGGRVDVSGQYEKGDLVKVEMTCRVGEVAFVDEVDEKTQQVVGCERRHKARPVQAPRVTPAGE